MPVRRRHDRSRLELTRAEEALLLDLPRPDTSDDGEWYFARLSAEEFYCCFPEVRAAVLSEWVRARPGTRPSIWWARLATEPRRRLGGVGTPAHERLANAPELYLGVPISWMTADQVELYRGLGIELGVPPLSDDDVPVFESQSAYLRRVGLLAPGEARRIRKAAFEPETLAEIFADAYDDVGRRGMWLCDPRLTVNDSNELPAWSLRRAAPR